VDVRRFPGSRRVPWTGSEQIGRHVRQRYVHLEGLGGRRAPQPGSPNGGWDSAQFRGYADHMGSREFLSALGRLERLAREAPSAVMCAEAPWWRCHRRLLSDVLVVRGWDVRHLSARGGSEPHALTEFARADGGAVSYPPAQADLGL
jgi:uncharacterized protein (DUF488 family)